MQDLNILDVLTPELFKFHSEFSITVSLLKWHAQILTGVAVKCQTAGHREAFSRVENPGKANLGGTGIYSCKATLRKEG